MISISAISSRNSPVRPPPLLKDYSLLMLSILHGFENMRYNDCFRLEIGMVTAETMR